MTETQTLERDVDDETELACSHQPRRLATCPRCRSAAADEALS